MKHKVRKMTFPLLAAMAAILVAPPAEANRGTGTTTTTQPDYVPPPQFGENPQAQLPTEPDVSTVVQPTVITVDLPAVTDPGAGLAGGGDPLGPVDAPATDEVLDRTESRPDRSFIPRVLSRTGAETLPLARAGVAALALGLGLVFLARRRVGPASA